MRVFLVIALLASMSPAAHARHEHADTRLTLTWRPLSLPTSLLSRHAYSVLGRPTSLIPPQHPLLIALYTIEHVARRLVEPTAYEPLPGLHTLSATPMLSLSSAGMVLHFEY